MQTGPITWTTNNYLNHVIDSAVNNARVISVSLASGAAVAYYTSEEHLNYYMGLAAAIATGTLLKLPSAPAMLNRWTRHCPQVFDCVVGTGLAGGVGIVVAQFAHRYFSNVPGNFTGVQG